MSAKGLGKPPRYLPADPIHYDPESALEMAISLVESGSFAGWQTRALKVHPNTLLTLLNLRVKDCNGGDTWLIERPHEYAAHSLSGYEVEISPTTPEGVLVATASFQHKLRLALDT